MDKTDVTKLTELLKHLEPGFLPYEIFFEIARLVVIPTIEVVIFSEESIREKARVLLIQRPINDKWWPNQWHVPGSILRATDMKHTFKDAFKRIETESMIKFLQEPIYLRTNFTQEKRGATLALQWYVLVSEKNQRGTFFDFDKLPENIIEEHKDLIAFARRKLKFFV